MDPQGKDKKHDEDEDGSQENGENGASCDPDLDSNDERSGQTTCTQETGAKKNGKSAGNVTSLVDQLEGDAGAKSGSNSLITEADNVLYVRTTVNRALVEHHNTAFVGTHLNRGLNSLKGSGNQVDGPQGVDKDLLEKNPDVEADKNRPTPADVTEVEAQDESQVENPRMASLKCQDEVGAAEYDQIAGNEENSTVEENQSNDSEGGNESQRGNDEMDNLKDGQFSSESKINEIVLSKYVNDVPAEEFYPLQIKFFLAMTFRFILSSFFNQEKKCKNPFYRMKVTKHVSGENTETKRFQFEVIPRVSIVIRPVLMLRTPIPPEAREEAYRLSSFEHYYQGRIHLDFTLVMVLVRNGFFCDIHNDILCAFCGRYLRRRDVLSGQYQIHRAHCIHQHGNISMESYGLNLADRMAEARYEHQLHVSGMPYQGQRACTFVQQIRNNGLHNIAPSGSSFSGTCVLPSLPAPNLPTNEQDNRMVNAQQNQPAPLVLVLEEDNHPVSSSSNIPMIESVVHSLVNSYIGCELIESGFSHQEVEAAVRTLVRRRELVSIETVAEELMRNA